LEAKHNKAQAARLFQSDDEDTIAGTADEAAQVEESGCKSVGKRDQKLSTDHAKGVNINDMSPSNNSHNHVRLMT
jgi:hypothetical protein